MPTPVLTQNCVLLAGRHRGLADGVRSLLEAEFRTVVMVADTNSLQEVADRLHPEVAVVDLSLAQEGGLAWLRTMRLHCPELKLVVLSVHGERAARQAALEAGADAFLLQRDIPTDLLPAIDFLRRTAVT